MNSYYDVTQYQDKKVIRLPPLYNTKDLLEFNCKGQKGYLQFCDVLLHFSITIPEDTIVDNDAVAKLFDSCEISINKERITSRSASNEYCYTSYLLTKAEYEAENIDSALVS